MKNMISLVLLFLSCLHVAGPGGSSETQNGFACTVLHTDGSPAGNALVRVRPVGFLAGNENSVSGTLSVIDTITDDSGQFTIKSLQYGDYYVEVNDMKSSAGLIQISAGKGSELHSDTVTLLPYARVSGKTDTEKVKFVQIMGLDRITTVATDGSFSFNDLPEGVFTIVFTSEDQQSPISKDSMSVKSGEINVVGYSLVKTIVLNTTASGADVSEDVFSFPVLIRFDGTDLQLLYSAALCFTKFDGTILPYQIEFHDSIKSTGAVWVKMDTVKGNGSTFIYMHYSTATRNENSMAEQVFDQDQFAGVWHLDEISNTNQGGYKDATSHQRNGTGVGIEAGRKTSGLIGLCQELNGIDEFIHISGILDESKSLTLSAWIRSTDSVGEIISIGDNAGMRFFSDSTGAGVYSYYSYKDANSWLPISAKTEPKLSQWHYMSLVIDSSSGLVSLYIDAVLEAQAVMLGELLYNKVGVDTYIGQAFRENCNFKGFIDEVRICNRARSSAWLHLCFENQRSDQLLVKY